MTGEGDVKSTMQLLTLKTDNGGKTTNDGKVELSALGISGNVLGYGGASKLKQNIDNNLRSSDAVWETEKSLIGKGMAQKEVVSLDYYTGDVVESKNETSITIGAKFFIGFELKLSYEKVYDVRGE
ncbi:hypothetical protein V6R21_01360 [Limibacter armeniacum]|uniref:hypothetical protein n=1 Tax=Limibacter armeniacum TaxID=466084 RepID=UPI002FE6334B